MNLRHLEIFRAVMQCRSTIGAARSLQISQPAVSNAIRVLENQLALQLFDRTGNRLAAREEARILFEESESLYQLSLTLKKTVENLKDNRQGLINIVATPQLGHTISPHAIQKLLLERPKVKVYFDVRRSYTVVEKIEAGSADVGLAIGLEAELSYSLNMIPVASMNMVCLVHSNHHLACKEIISPKDLSSNAFIGLEMGSRLSPLIRAAFKAEGVTYRASVEVRYSESACLLVNSGVGVAIVDWFSAKAYARQYAELIIIPFYPNIRVDAVAVLSKHRQPSRLSQLFIEAIHDSVAEFIQKK